MSSEFVKVGKVKDAHGIRGELFVVIFAGEAAWLPKLESLRLLPNDEAPAEQARTFEIKSVRTHKNGIIAKTSELKTRNDAEELKGWTLEIPSEFFVSQKGESIYLREIEGFTVKTKDRGDVGPIVAFSTNGVQDLLVVKTANGEFEIPFVEAFVQNIDYDAKLIEMDLPLGLLGEEAD